MSDGAGGIDHDRRRFLGTAAMMIAGARLGRLRAGGASPSPAEAMAEAGTVEADQRAPRELAALGGAAEWLNSPRLTPSSLAGKVVLVDFWTYTCINWLRTLPYVRAWAQKYREGLVLIGVHTPEFAFERNVDNVRRAVKQMRIEYPVAIDNDYSIWRAFNNQYWPALYFIDARGRVRQHHFGEGEYRAIREDHSRVVDRSRGRRHQRRVCVDRRQGAGSGCRLGQPEVSGKLRRARADGEFRVAWRCRARSASRLCRPCAPGAQSMGAGRRVDDRETGNRYSTAPMGGS